MKNTTTVVYLVIAGFLLLAIGGAILLAPHAFHGGNGIPLGDTPSGLFTLLLRKGGDGNWRIVSDTTTSAD